MFSLVFSGLLVLSSYLFYRCHVYPYYLSPLKRVPTPPLRWFDFLWGHGMYWNRNVEGKVVRDLTERIDHTGYIRILGVLGQEYLLTVNQQALREVYVDKDADLERPGLLNKSLCSIAGKGFLSASLPEYDVRSDPFCMHIHSC